MRGQVTSTKSYKQNVAEGGKEGLPPPASRPCCVDARPPSCPHAPHTGLHTGLSKAPRSRHLLQPTPDTTWRCIPSTPIGTKPHVSCLSVTTAKGLDSWGFNTYCPVYVCRLGGPQFTHLKTEKIETWPLHWSTSRGGCECGGRSGVCWGWPGDS